MVFYWPVGDQNGMVPKPQSNTLLRLEYVRVTGSQDMGYSGYSVTSAQREHTGSNEAETRQQQGRNTMPARSGPVWLKMHPDEADDG